MDAFNDPAVREIWVMKSAQIGWTSIIENVIGYHVHQDPSPILLVQPTLEIAEAFSKDRLAPMVRDTPSLRGTIADARSRDSGNTLLHKTFIGGHLTLAGANSPSGLAARPIRVVLFDEIDRYPPSSGAEGDPINLGTKRTTAFWNKRIAGGSTPTIKGASKIEQRFGPSDQRYYFVPCPHCHEYQRLVWSQVKWDEGKPETARYLCVTCGVLWSDGERIESLVHGEWRASKPFNGIAGFHLNEIYSPFVKLEEMARNFLEAKKLPETLQTFVNTSLGETWEEIGSSVEPEGLLKRCEPYGVDNIPADVLLLTVGGDTQTDRVELQLLGWGADEECWIIEQRVFRGDPGTRGLWQDVAGYLESKFVLEDGRELLVEASCIDSGGSHTQAVYEFVKGRRRRRIWAIKGMAGTGRLAWPRKASRAARSNAQVFVLGVDTIKGVLYGRLGKIAEPGPGYIHLPAGADAEFCRQLTSERAVTKYVRGRSTVVWTPRSAGIAQEGQDCWVYGYAAMLGRGGPEHLKRLALRFQRLAPRPERVAPVTGEQPTPIEAPPKPLTTAQPQPVRKRGSWMGNRRGWIKR